MTGAIDENSAPQCGKTKPHFRFATVGATLLLSLAATGPISASGTVAHPDPLATTLAAPPSEERDAIRLSGATDNSSPEVWETRMETRTVSNGAPLSRAELWVRNVSRPTLERFLPEPSQSTGAAMIIAPGGAFLELAIEREGYAVARWLNQRGIAAFVLKYRLAPTPADPQRASAQMATWAREVMVPALQSSRDPLTNEQHAAEFEAVENGLEAVRYVRAHAGEWHLSPDRIGFMGFSAGAVIAVTVAQKADAASRPDIVAPIYGALLDHAAVPASAPPAFIVAAADDTLSSSSLAIYSSWRASAVPAELHVLESGGHGFGMLQQGKSSDYWTEPFDRWLAVHSFETRTASLASTK